MESFEPLVQLTPEPIKIEPLLDFISSPTSGANSVFLGTTKSSFQGKEVKLLEYEAYEPMALKEMTKICREAKMKWPPLDKMVMVHRLGPVPVCQASVVIGASSEHRREAQEVVKFALEELKSKVPIWKKEIYEDGAVWKQNAECFWLQKQ